MQAVAPWLERNIYVVAAFPYGNSRGLNAAGLVHESSDSCADGDQRTRHIVVRRAGSQESPPVVVGAGCLWERCS